MPSFDINTSELQKNPRSKVLKQGYINVYSKLNEKELRQVFYKEKYKKQHPHWDETMVFLSNRFKSFASKREDLVVFDAGCGNGNYVIDENRTSIRWAVGLDVSPEFTKKNVCLDQIEYGDIANLPFENNTFDVVLSLWVLEHIKSADGAFSEIFRVLKPGGLFMFAAPNKAYLPLKAVEMLRSAKANHFLNKRLFGRDPVDVFEAYYRANDLSTLNALATSSGFKVETLKLNYDPSYTSFNFFTYYLSNIVTPISNEALFPHIVGILKKELQ